MGRKKYFCDYCLKSFNDDPKARSLHLNSFRHLQLKKEHYQNFKDAATILEEESSKEPCMKFQREGVCRFGTSCRFSHLLPNEFDNLRAEAENLVCRQSAPPLLSLPSFSEWWTKRMSLKQDTEESIMGHELNSSDSSLPISLRPFDIAEYLAANFGEWGE